MIAMNRLVDGLYLIPCGYQDADCMKVVSGT
jgi:hypothetical protein